MAERNILEGRSWLSLRYRGRHLLSNLPKFKITQEDLILADERAPADAKTANARGRNFSFKEDQEILEFIINGNEFYRVGGTLLWKTMEEAQVAGGRSWQSLKGHFDKVIMAKLDSYQFLSGEQQKNLRGKTIVRDAEGKVAEGQSRKNQPYVKEEDDVILSYAATSKLGAGGLTKIWKQLEKEKVLVGRSARSMQERYQKIKNKVKQGGDGEKGEEGREEDLLAVRVGKIDIAEEDVAGREEDGEEEGEDMDASFIIVDF